MKGRVKWWIKEKGYGFIEYKDNKNIFVHIELNDLDTYNFEENQEIEFALIEKNNCQFLKLIKAK